MNKVICIILSCVFVTHSSFAQETNNKLSQLDILTGSWMETTETRLSANGPWETNKGKADINKTTGTKTLGAPNKKRFGTLPGLKYS